MIRLSNKQIDNQAADSGAQQRDGNLRNDVIGYGVIDEVGEQHNPRVPAQDLNQPQAGVIGLRTRLGISSSSSSNRDVSSTIIGTTAA
jgi:hypothetical protein